MKRQNFFLVFVLCLIVFSFFVRAQDEPTAAINGSEVDKMQQNINDLVPINDSGNFDPSNYKSKAEQRIEELNGYVGKYTQLLWGVELSMSWIFIFSVIVWILLIELIVVPVSEIFGYKIYVSFIPAGIIATLAMQGFGKDFVAWMGSIATGWEAGITIFLLMLAIGFFYSFGMIFFGKKIKKAKKEAEEEKLRRAKANIEVKKE